MLKVQRASIAVFVGFEGALSTHVLANGDEFHFRSNDPLPGIMDLSNCSSIFRAKRPPSSSWKRIELAPIFDQRKVASSFGEISIILRQDFAAVVFFNTAASDNPLPSQSR